MAFARTNKLAQPEQTQPEQPKQPEQKTPNKQPEQIDGNTARIGQVIIGYCHGCGHKHQEIDPEGFPELRCLCHDCVKQGIIHETLNLPMCK